MYCRNCGRRLEDGETVCPVCGPETLEQENTQEVPQQEAPQQEVTQPQQEAATPKQEQKPINKKKLILVIAAAVLVVAIIAAIIVVVTRPDPATQTDPTETGAQVTEDLLSGEIPEVTQPTLGEPTAEDLNAHPVLARKSYSLAGDDKAGLSTVAITAGGKAPTNGEFSIWFWQTYYDLLGNMGYYVSLYGLDTSAPLDTQVCSMADTSMSWQQFMIEQTIVNWHSYYALAQEAEKNGLSLTQDEQADLDAMEDEMNASAESYGFASAQEMLEADYGQGVTIEDYKSFVYLLMLGNHYYTQQQEALAPTDNEVAAHYAEKAEEYGARGIAQDGTPATTDVRHILIQPEGEAAGENGAYTAEQMAAARTQAQAILDSWLAGGATEESFITLANEKSTDPGSNTNGGLYEGVTPGQMVTEFNDWCFDPARKYGDYGLVETTYGVHIMFFVAASDTEYWYSVASRDLTSELMQKLVDDTMAAYPITVDYSKLGISTVVVETAAE